MSMCLCLFFIVQSHLSRSCSFGGSEKLSAERRAVKFCSKVEWGRTTRWRRQNENKINFNMLSPCLQHRTEEREKGSSSSFWCIEKIPINPILSWIISLISSLRLDCVYFPKSWLVQQEKCFHPPLTPPKIDQTSASQNEKVFHFKQHRRERERAIPNAKA